MLCKMASNTEVLIIIILILNQFIRKRINCIPATFHSRRHSRTPMDYTCLCHPSRTRSTDCPSSKLMRTEKGLMRTRRKLESSPIRGPSSYEVLPINPCILHKTKLHRFHAPRNIFYIAMLLNDHSSIFVNNL